MTKDEIQLFSSDHSKWVCQINPSFWWNNLAEQEGGPKLFCTLCKNKYIFKSNKLYWSFVFSTRHNFPPPPWTRSFISSTSNRIIFHRSPYSPVTTNLYWWRVMYNTSPSIPFITNHYWRRVTYNTGWWRHELQ